MTYDEWLLVEAQFYERTFTAEQRKALAKSGAALPDGSFPIENKDDLSNAIGLVGNASDPAAAKAHVIKRAKSLGATDMLPKDWSGSTKESAVTVTEDAVPLRERAVGGDGIATIKLIAPGFGSSGYYSRELLERDGPTAFKVGTKMYWNHPTEAEERERPEGDLRNLAGEIVTTPRFQEGPNGPGLYAESKIFEPFRDVANDLAPHIGLSIRASGKAQEGEVEGKSGRIVTAITEGQSVDFVTVAGAGGQVVELFEAARRGGTVDKPTEKETQLTQEVERLTAELAEARKPKTPDDKPTEREQQLSESVGRLQESIAVRDARDIVREAIRTHGGVPDPTAARLVEALPRQIKLKEDGSLDREAFATIAKEAVESEVAYIAEAAGAGRVRGLGGGGPREPLTDEQQTKLDERLKANLVSLGTDDKAAEFAVKG